MRFTSGPLLYPRDEKRVRCVVTGMRLKPRTIYDDDGVLFSERAKKLAMVRIPNQQSGKNILIRCFPGPGGRLTEVV